MATMFGKIKVAAVNFSYRNAKTGKFARHHLITPVGNLRKELARLNNDPNARNVRVVES